MNELLFKLKKDGQCEGLLWWTGKWMFRYPIEGTSWLDVQLVDNRVICTETGVELCRFTSIHPFICRDRHDKYVFEGDKFIDRRDNAIETMTLDFWYLSLERETEYVELIDAEQQAQAGSDAGQGADKQVE